MGARPSSIARSKQTELPQEHLFDSHPEVSLDFEIVRRAARDRYTRPFLILDTAIVREKARRFVAAMPRVRPHYAVKANPDPRVLKVLIEEGAGFEIESAELTMLPKTTVAVEDESEARKILRLTNDFNQGSSVFSKNSITLTAEASFSTAFMVSTCESPRNARRPDSIS